MIDEKDPLGILGNKKPQPVSKDVADPLRILKKKESTSESSVTPSVSVSTPQVEKPTKPLLGFGGQLEKGSYKQELPDATTVDKSKPLIVNRIYEPPKKTASLPEQQKEQIDLGGGGANPKFHGEIKNSLIQGAAPMISDVSRNIAGLAKKINLFGEYDDKKTTELSTYKFADWLDKTVKEQFPVSEESQNSFMGQLLQGGGSLGMFAAGGWAGKAMKLGEVAPIAMWGASQNAGAEYKKAYDMTTAAHELSDEDYYTQYGNNGSWEEVIGQKNQLAQQDPSQVAFSVMPGAAAVGSLEGLPIGSFLKRIDGATNGLFQKALGSQVMKMGVTGQATMGAIEEAVQEASTQLFTNINANLIYDKTRDIYDGVAESGMYGGILGGTLNGLGAALTRKRQDPNNTIQDNIAIDKTLEYVEKQQEAIKDVKPNEFVKPTDDIPAVQELKTKKNKVEADLSSDEVAPQVKVELAKKVEEIDQQIAEAKANDISTKSEQIAVEGEIKATETEIAALTPQLEAVQSDEAKAVINNAIASKADKLAQLEARREEVKPIEITPIKTDGKKSKSQSNQEGLLGTEEKTGVADVTPSETKVEQPKKEVQPNTIKNEQPTKNKVTTGNAKQGVPKSVQKVEGEKTSKGKANEGIGRGKVPAAQRKTKDRVILKALSEPMFTARGMALQHFINGGKISPNGLKQLYSNKKGENVEGEDLGKKIQGEINARMQYKGNNNNKAHMVDSIAESIYAQANQHSDSKIELSKIKNAVEEVIQEFTSIKQMARAVVTEEMGLEISDDEKTISERVDRMQEQTPEEDLDIQDAAVTAMDNMTDEQTEQAAEGNIEDDWLSGLDETTTETPWDEKTISAIEKLKIDTKNTLGAFGLAPAAWNTILDGLILAIKGGVAVSEAIKEAIKKAKALSKDFDESGFMDDMRGIFGDEVDGVAEPKVDVKEEKAESTKAEEKPKEKVMKLSQRQMDSDEIDDELKQGIKDLGINYIPTNIQVTAEEAEAYVDAFESVDELDTAMDNIMDMKNEMTGYNRGTIGAVLFERYNKKARTAETQSEKLKYQSKAAKVARFSALILNQGGKTGAVAGKIWKKMLSSTPEGAITTLQQDYAEKNEKVLKKDAKDIKDAKKDLQEILASEEGQAAIQVEVEKEIGKQAEKLFGKEQKEKISNFFDSLLINTKGKAFDATMGLPIAVYNGAIKAAKNATLLGADAANAIKAGVDYVNSKYGKAWKQKDFELLLGDGLKTLKPRKKVDLTEKTKNKILDAWEKRLKKMTPENRKKLLANSIQELNNVGALSEERFKELYAEAMGLPTVTEEMKQNIFNLIDTINNAETALDAYKKVFEEGTPTEIKKAKEAYIKALQDAAKANDNLSGYFRADKNVWETLGAITQGNLLTPASLLVNIWSNLNFLPMRYLSGGVASITDYILSKGAEYTSLSKIVSKDRTVDILARSKGARAGLVPGTKEGWHDLIHGLTSDEVSQRDLTQKLEPLKAAASLWTTYHGKNKMATKGQVNAWVEVTFGAPAEVFFRLLNLGDKPFRKMAEMGKAYELASLKGLKGKDFERFIEFPDAKSAEQIKAAGDEATFQKENTAQHVIQFWTNRLKNVPWVGQPLAFLLKGVIPYVKTPTNIIGETFNYAFPPLTIARSAYYASEGERAKSLEYFGKAVVGSMLSYAAYQLLINGLITGGGGDDEPKERAIQYENIPPNSMNVSAIRRGLSGQGFASKDSDTWINYTKTGITGSIVGMYANMGADKTKEQINNMGLMDISQNAAFSIVKTSLEQSYLKGTNDVLLAMMKGGNEADRFIVNYVNAISSTVYPNTVATFSRTLNDNIKNINDDELGDDIKNMFKYKMFMGSDLPSRVTLWGEKVENAPPGRNKYLYNMFDITKYKNVPTDNFGFKLYTAWNTTKDKDLLPNPAQSNFSQNGVEIKLTPKELEKFQMLVGKERKALVETYVNSPEWDEDDHETRVNKLQALYKDGRDIGKELFIDSEPKIYDKINAEQ